mgnify:CR=1 FL=1
MDGFLGAMIYSLVIMLVVLEIKCKPRFDFKGPNPILWYTIKTKFGNKIREYIEFKI